MEEAVRKIDYELSLRRLKSMLLTMMRKLGASFMDKRKGFL
jgi:hypothetical protein